MFTTLTLIAIVLLLSKEVPCETGVAGVLARQLLFQERFNLAKHVPRLHIVRVERREEVPGSFQRRFVVEDKDRILMLLEPGRVAPRGSGVGREQDVDAISALALKRRLNADHGEMVVRRTKREPIRDRAR